MAFRGVHERRRCSGSAAAVEIQGVPTQNKTPESLRVPQTPGTVAGKWLWQPRCGSRQKRESHQTTKSECDVLAVCVTIIAILLVVAFAYLTLEPPRAPFHREPGIQICGNDARHERAKVGAAAEIVVVNSQPPTSVTISSAVRLWSCHS